MCSAPNVYMCVYTLIGAQIVPLNIFGIHVLHQGLQINNILGMTFCIYDFDDSVVK